MSGKTWLDAERELFAEAERLMQRSEYWEKKKGERLFSAAAHLKTKRVAEAAENRAARKKKAAE